MTYKLKSGQPGFEIVDGPLAGHRYVPDQVYDEIPPLESDRFERAEKATVTQLKQKPIARARIEDERA
jgi:hypothetical protein